MKTLLFFTYTISRLFIGKVAGKWNWNYLPHSVKSILKLKNGQTFSGGECDQKNIQAGTGKRKSDVSCPGYLHVQFLYPWNGICRYCTTEKIDIIPGEICYRRHKTGQLMRVGINEEIHRILEKYENIAGEYIFPLFTEGQEPYAGYKSAYHKTRYSLKKYPTPSV